MSKFDTLIKFTVEGSDAPFFAKSDPQTKTVAPGSTVAGFRSWADFESGQRSEQVVIKKVIIYEPGRLRIVLIYFSTASRAFAF
jgi:hypothetical protein